MPQWLIPRDSLTPEQIRAVELSPVGHRVITGAPGSGKTIVLLHRARYLADTLNVSPERFRIFVYTNVLSEYIRSAMELLRIPLSCISTFDKWCFGIYRRDISNSLPWDAENQQPDFEQVRSGVRKYLMKYGGRHMYDFVLVDEGQDLEPEAFETLTAGAGHITVFMDHKQQVYDKGSGRAQVLESLGVRKVSMQLLEAFRCSPYIVTLASAFIADAREKEDFINQTRVPQTEKETPVVYIAPDIADEMRRLADIIRTRQNSGDRIAILLPHNRQADEVQQSLAQAGLEVEVKIKARSGQEGRNLDFASDRPKLMTYHSAKGITFDTVLMPRMNMLEDFSRDGIDRLVFVGITRATKWVYMSAAGEGLHVFDVLKGEARKGSVRYQAGGEQAGDAAVQEGAGGDVELDDLF